MDNKRMPNQSTTYSAGNSIKQSIKHPKIQPTCPLVSQPTMQPTLLSFVAVNNQPNIETLKQAAGHLTSQLKKQFFFFPDPSNHRSAS